MSTAAAWILAVAILAVACVVMVTVALVIMLEDHRAAIARVQRSYDESMRQPIGTKPAP